MTTPRDRRPLRRGRHDEEGQALVEFALALPVIALLMAVAFNGWNGMQLAIRLTSAARAGAVAAAHDLDTGNPASAQCDAAAAVNQEEGVSGVYQCTSSSSPDYVAITEGQQSIPSDPNNPGSATSINVVTVTISQASVTLVPIVGNFAVTAHATARYS
jgi:Flp pilus assembly protein TadG